MLDKARGCHSSLASLLLAVVNSGAWYRSGIAAYKLGINAGQKHGRNRGFQTRCALKPMRERREERRTEGFAMSASAEGKEEARKICSSVRPQKAQPDESEFLPYLAPKDYRAAVKVLSPFMSKDRLDKLLEVLSHRSGEVRFAIEDPSNPSNAWACLRSMDSFGIQYVDLITNEDRFSSPYEQRRGNLKMKTAMGSEKWLDLSLHHSTADYVQGLKKADWCVVAVDVSPKSAPIQELDLSSLGPTTIVIGNERDGISDELRELADHCVYLPTLGFAESFSLSVRCAVLLSHMNSRNALKHGTLPESEKDRLLYEWVAKSVKAARPLLRREGFNISWAPPKRQRYFGGFVAK